MKRNWQEYLFTTVNYFIAIAILMAVLVGKTKLAIAVKKFFFQITALLLKIGLVVFVYISNSVEDYISINM